MSNQYFERENGFLGALMQPGVKITSAMESLKPEWFSGHQLHPLIYSAWLKLHKGDHPVDAVSIFEFIRRDNFNIPEDTFQYLVAMQMNGLAMMPSMRFAARAITSDGKKMELRRSLIDAMQELDKADDYDKGRAVVMNALDSKLIDGVERGLLTGVDIAKMGGDFIDARLEGKLVGLATGFDDLDEMMFGGFRGGEIYTVFGPPKSGKTTTATTILENIARTKLPCGTPPVIAVFSREMREVQLAVRHFASLGGASQRNILTGKMTDQDWNGVMAAAGVLAESNLVYDLDSDTPSQIALKCAQIKRKYGRLDMIVIDHIGLVRSDDKKHTRQQEVTEITWALKKLAGRMDVPIIIVAQSNRRYSDRTDRTPQLADLAESSSIEKDSDAIIGIVSHRDGELKGWVEIHVIAARLGEQGMAVGVFNNGRVLPGSMSEYLSARNRAEQDNKSGKGKYEGGI